MPPEFNPIMLRAVSLDAFRSQSPTGFRAKEVSADLEGLADKAAFAHLLNPITAGDLLTAPGLGFGPTDVPHAADQQGNWFTDHANPGGKWYLPAFALADDPDAGFGFAASRTDTNDSNGNPFHKCRVTLTVRKVVPDDVVAWKAANPSAPLREVPLEDLEVALVMQSTNPVTGFVESTPCLATLTPTGDGLWLATVDNVLGNQVIVLYENLASESASRLVVSALYRVWRVQPRPQLPPGMMMTMILRFEVAAVPYEQDLPIGRKFAADPYSLKYTLEIAGATRPILNAGDLRDLNVRQSEFEELRALGDVNARFPTISKLYFGVLSRTIVVIPARYVILRDTGTCAAICHALVDSSPGLNAGCKFQFEFTLVPDVSQIDLLQLLSEVNGLAETKGAKLKLPTAIKPDSGTTLASEFVTSFRFADAPGMMSEVALSAEIREQAGGIPAIANANVFINQLRATQEPFLHGTVGVRLDDAFPTPINVPVLLSFKATREAGGGTAGVTLRVDEANGKAVIENGSAFDLLVSRAALLTPDGAKVFEVGQPLAANASIALDLPADHAGLSVMLDSELAVTGLLSRTELFKYLQFRPVDVQNTQFDFGVNAASVNFVNRGIDRIEVLITLIGAPQVSVPALALVKDHMFDSTRVLLPLDQAMVEMDATLVMTAHFTDPAQAPSQSVVRNDFAQQPIFVIKDSDLPS